LAPNFVVVSLGVLPRTNTL